MSNVVHLPSLPVAAIIVHRATAGPHPIVVVPRTRSIPGKPSSAISQAWGCINLETALACAKWLSERCGLPVLVDPGALASNDDDSGPGLAA